MTTLGSICVCLAAIGLLVTVLQTVALVLHAHRRRPGARASPPISILKPLSGLDDGLADNLDRFCNLDYPRYELLLGVAHASDAAYPLALEFARRHPDRVRVVVQGREHGLNPKVSQLVGLERHARYDVLVVSDSNVRVSRRYLQDIAAHLDDDVGVVTHVVAGAGERTLGAMMDNLHLTTTIGPGVLAAKLLAGQDVVVGKSMAMQRRHLDAIGGFAAFADLLAEDYFIGRAMLDIGKRIAIGRERVYSVARVKSVGRFFDRYLRWSVMHRFAVGRPVYTTELLLCPITFALLATCCGSEAGFAVIAAKLGIDLAVSRTLRKTPLTITHVAALVLKDLSLACMLVYGFFADTIDWRGSKRRVLAGTQLEPLASGAEEIAR